MYCSFTRCTVCSAWPRSLGQFYIVTHYICNGPRLPGHTVLLILYYTIVFRVEMHIQTDRVADATIQLDETYYGGPVSLNV